MFSGTVDSRNNKWNTEKIAGNRTGSLGALQVQPKDAVEK